MNNTGKGNLPNKCPNCNADDWEWDSYDPDSMSQKATCNKCESQYFEMSEVIGWDKL